MRTGTLLAAVLSSAITLTTTTTSANGLYSANFCQPSTESAGDDLLYSYMGLLNDGNDGVIVACPMVRAAYVAQEYCWTATVTSYSADGISCRAAFVSPTSFGYGAVDSTSGAQSAVLTNKTLVPADASVHLECTIPERIWSGTIPSYPMQSRLKAYTLKECLI